MSCNRAGNCRVCGAIFTNVYFKPYLSSQLNLFNKALSKAFQMFCFENTMFKNKIIDKFYIKLLIKVQVGRQI